MPTDIFVIFYFAYIELKLSFSKYGEIHQIIKSTSIRESWAVLNHYHRNEQGCIAKYLIELGNGNLSCKIKSFYSRRIKRNRFGLTFIQNNYPLFCYFLGFFKIIENGIQKYWCVLVHNVPSLFISLLDLTVFSSWVCFFSLGILSSLKTFVGFILFTQKMFLFSCHRQDSFRHSSAKLKFSFSYYRKFYPMDFNAILLDFWWT